MPSLLKSTRESKANYNVYYYYYVNVNFIRAERMLTAKEEIPFVTYSITKAFSSANKSARKHIQQVKLETVPTIPMVYNISFDDFPCY